MNCHDCETYRTDGGCVFGFAGGPCDEYRARIIDLRKWRDKKPKLIKDLEDLSRILSEGDFDPED